MVFIHEHKRGVNQHICYELKIGAVGVSANAINIDIERKEMGLDWMLRPAERSSNSAKAVIEEQQEEPGHEEVG